MPIYYDIKPDLDFLVYVFQGECTAKQYYSAYHSMYQTDNRRHHGMKILMDFTHAEFDFEVEDLRAGIQIVAENKQNSHPRDRVALLSNSSSINLLERTLKVLANDLPMDLENYNNFHDAISWLGLMEHAVEAEIFLEEIRKRKEMKSKQ